MGRFCRPTKRFTGCGKAAPVSYNEIDFYAGRGKEMTKEKAKVISLVLTVLVLALASRAVAADFKKIDTERLHSMVVDDAYRLEGGREKLFTVIDARSKEEYGEAHIFTAVSVPEKDFEKTKALLPKDKEALLWFTVTR